MNVSPNRDGLLDDNTITALKTIGTLWNDNTPVKALPGYATPLVSSNLAKGRPCTSSWSDDMWIMDFANDDDFTTAWISNSTVTKPWWEVQLDHRQPFNAVIIAQKIPAVKTYRLEVFDGSTWQLIHRGETKDKILVERFPEVWGTKVRLSIDGFSAPPQLAEVGVYLENRDATAKQVNN